MPKDDEQYRSILGILRDNKLNWVAEQIQDQVRAGKNVSKEAIESSKSIEQPINSGYAAVDTMDESRSQKKMTFVSTVDYSESEKLEIAIRAIEIITIDIWDIQNYTQTMLVPDRGENNVSIDFIPDDYDESSASGLSDFYVDSIASRNQLVSVLKRLRSAADS